MKLFTIFLLFFSLFNVQAFELKSLSYSNKFTLNVSGNNLSFKEGKVHHDVLINKCNKKYLKRITSLIKEPKDKKTRFPSKSRSRVDYSLNNMKKTANKGSKLHMNLEHFPQKMIGYISLMRKKCD